MKRFFALLCICAVLLTLAACAGPESLSVSEPESKPEQDQLPLRPLPDNVTWAVEPALEFTCIAPATLSRGDEAAFWGTCGLITSDGLSEVVIDGKYGLIDHNGQWAVPCEFDSLFCGYGGKYALENILSPKAVPEDTFMSRVWVCTG